MCDLHSMRNEAEDEAIRAAVRSLECVLQDYAHLAPEFAMIAARDWAESYKPGRVVRVYAQASELEKFKAGEIKSITIRNERHFPFLYSMEVTLR